MPRRQFGRLFSIEYWDDPDAPAGLPTLTYVLDDPRIGPRLRGRDVAMVGQLLDSHPLFVDTAERDGAVHAVSMMLGEHQLDQIADARAALPQIVDLVAVAWSGHEDAVALPWDKATRDLVSEILTEIARTNPRSSEEFWRFHFFRQFDLHLRM